MKVLEIGAGGLPKAQIIPGWEEAEIETLDMDKQWKPTYLCDAFDIPEELAGQYDGVLASHVLEHFGWWETEDILVSWAKLLKPEGELHIVVPSLEWAGRAILSESIPLCLMPHLFGGHDTEWNGHKSMFHMRTLRYQMELAGLHVERARTGAYKISVYDGEGKKHIMPAEEHYVMGRKK